MTDELFTPDPSIPYDDQHTQHPKSLVARHMAAAVVDLISTLNTKHDPLWKQLLPAADKLLHSLKENRRPKQMHFSDSASWERTGAIRFRLGGFMTRTCVLQVHESRQSFDTVRLPDPPAPRLRQVYRWRDATYKEALELDSLLQLDPDFMFTERRVPGVFDSQGRYIPVPPKPPTGGSSIQPPPPRWI